MPKEGSATNIGELNLYKPLELRGGNVDYSYKDYYRAIKISELYLFT